MSDKQDRRDKVFMKMAELMASLSDCPSRKVGAVLVKDNRIVSTGYNGVPKGVNVQCPRCAVSRKKRPKSGEGLEYCTDVHAEINCIIQAAYHGVSSNGCVMYCTTKPCIPCLAACINAGVERVYYLKEYNANYPHEFLLEIDVIKFNY